MRRQALARRDRHRDRAASSRGAGKRGGCREPLARCACAALGERRRQRSSACHRPPTPRNLLCRASAKQRRQKWRAALETPFGEIDIVARRRGVLAFVEVKTRASMDAALEAVTERGSASWPPPGCGSHAIHGTPMAKSASMSLSSRPADCRATSSMLSLRRLNVGAEKRQPAALRAAHRLTANRTLLTTGLDAISYCRTITNSPVEIARRIRNR